MDKNNNRPLGWTTIEEAKQLVEAGLPVETADMRYSFIGQRIKEATENDYLLHTGSVNPNSFSFKHKFLVPCWSLGALSILMPKLYESEQDGGCYPVLRMDHNSNKWYYGYRNSIYITNYYNTGIEAAIDMVLWLLKNKLI